jgi:hypothetical protein
VNRAYWYIERVVVKNSGNVLLIVATALFGFFNAVAVALFLWAGTLDARSDANAGLTSLSVVVAWVGDLVAFVLACVGAYVGRARAGAILWGLGVMLFAIGSGGVAVIAWLGRAIANMPVPIH